MRSTGWREEVVPPLQVAPLLVAGAVGGATALVGGPAVLVAGGWVAAWATTAAVGVVRPARPDRPAPWRLRPHWRDMLREVLQVADRHAIAIGAGHPTVTDADRGRRQRLVDELVLDAWAIARWADDTERRARALADERSAAPIRARLLEASRRLEAITAGVRGAADAAASERLRDRPAELDRPEPTLEELADLIHAHRLALDELRGG